MKTLADFARFLDKQIDYVDELKLNFDEEIANTFGGIVQEAARHAAGFGCPAVIMRRKIGPLLVREVLGRYRLWVQQNRPEHDLSVDEAAERLGVSVKTIRLMVTDGRLRHHKVGRQIRITAEDCVMRSPEPEPEKPRRAFRHLAHVA